MVASRIGGIKTCVYMSVCCVYEFLRQDTIVIARERDNGGMHHGWMHACTFQRTKMDGCMHISKDKARLSGICEKTT